MYLYYFENCILRAFLQGYFECGEMYLECDSDFRLKLWIIFQSNTVDIEIVKTVVYFDINMRWPP